MTASSGKTCATHGCVAEARRVAKERGPARGGVVLATRAGRKSDFTGRFIRVWQKRAGVWHVIADHFYPTDPVPALRTAVAIDESLYARYVGEYEFINGDVFTVTRTAEGLAVSPKRDPVPWTMQLVAESPTEFFAKDDDIQIVFVPRGNGDVGLLSIYHGRASRARKLAAK